MEANGNPEKAIEAITEPSPLTIVQMALLEKIKSPILKAKTDDLTETIKAIWITSIPVDEALQKMSDAENQALLWAKDFSGLDYRNRAKRLIGSIVKFWEMIPAPDNDAKKKPDTTPTDGSPN